MTDKVIVTGGAGFIGSNLVDALVQRGEEVHIVDDFSTGQEAFIQGVAAQVHRLDLTKEAEGLREIFAGAKSVFHLAANADVRFGMQNTRRDLEQNVVATMRVAEAAAAEGVSDVIFSSTGAVYGETLEHPTPESAKFPMQTSLYGMSKVAAEGILSTYASNNHFRTTIFRFVSVLGDRYMHGHVIDFVRQLVNDPSTLRILGDGTQRKSYMHVHDCVGALLDLRASSSVDVFNLGSDEFCTVKDSVDWICLRMSLDPELRFGRGRRGWIGDNPFTWLDVSKARRCGWQAERKIKDSIEETVDWLLSNRWALQVEDPRR